jgi:TrpR family trp operon transcriptional repressor
MPSRSKRHKPKSSNADKVSGILAGLTEPDEVSRFLGEILTPAERYDIETRWELMERLDDGMSQRDVAEALGVSLCKITRGAKILKDPEAITPRLIKGRHRS